ncbi:MAG: YceI family protein [Acidobacteriia bacterium]|nr:YceI family protein [Terriglobia bacterium]
MAMEKWKFDLVHSNIGFSVRHLMISKVHGQFKSWTGTLETDESNPSATRLEVEIDAASIDTREPQRDDHLRSADFLDAAHYPKLTFRSARVEKVDDEHYRVAGDLTIRGVMRQVVLDTEFLGRQKDPWGGERAGFTARTSVDRKDYGLIFNMPLEGGGFLVGDKVEIALDVEVVKESVMTA